MDGVDVGSDGDHGDVMKGQGCSNFASRLRRHGKASVGRRLIRHQGQQVRDADVHPGLRKQRRHLTAMVRLMVEEMQHQTVEVSCSGHALAVDVLQHVIQLVLCHRLRPFRDALVEQFAVFFKVQDVGKKLLIKAGGRGQISYQIQRRVVGGMSGETLEPDRVSRDQMIQRPEDGAKERPPIGAQLRAAETLDDVRALKKRVAELEKKLEETPKK